MALEDKRVDAQVPLDDRVAAAIAARVADGRLSCAAACEAAAHLGVPPIVVGTTADRMQVRISACQLGLFRSQGEAEVSGSTEATVPDGLAEALLAARSEGGEISCAMVWQEAQRFFVSRIQAGRLADRLGIKVRDCHLGAF